MSDQMKILLDSFVQKKTDEPSKDILKINIHAMCHPQPTV